MPERAPARGALAAVIVALVAASVLLGVSALLGWAQLDVREPLRGIVAVRVDGSAVVWTVPLQRVDADAGWSEKWRQRRNLAVR